GLALSRRGVFRKCRSLPTTKRAQVPDPCPGRTRYELLQQAALILLRRRSARQDVGRVRSRLRSWESWFFCGRLVERRMGYPTDPRFFCHSQPAPPGLCGFLPQPLSSRVIPCAVVCLLSPRRCAMLVHATEPLFAWGELEDHATRATIRDFL